MQLPKEIRELAEKHSMNVTRRLSQDPIYSIKEDQLHHLILELLSRPAYYKKHIVKGLSDNALYKDFLIKQMTLSLDNDTIEE
jgi:hypothetical protein